MESQDTSINSLLPTREVLLLNNEKFPALALYSAKHEQLEGAYIEWLKNESLGKHVCYLDLTFEIPDNEKPLTLSIVSSEMTSDIYEKIMHDFILGGNTLYSHKAFKIGLNPKINDDNSEKFFICEINNTVQLNNTEDAKEKGFFAKEMPLKIFLDDAKKSNSNYFAEIDAKDIKEHWNKWIELHTNEETYPKIMSNAKGALKWILVVPLGILSDSGIYKPMGSIFLGMDNYCKKDQVIYFTRSLILLLLSSSQRYYVKAAFINSIKSAVAAIMARNMSHNLGSHVFYYVRNEITRLADSGDTNSPITSTHKGLVKFLQYVQERQDFVATITSQDDYFFAPLNLKLDVLDEITPDAVDIRHNSEPPSKNFILKYLVNSESIARHDKGEINTSIKEIEIEILFKGKPFKSKDTNVDATDFYDINIAVQGGQQSRHAFLIIIENIIRNAAKHGFDKTISDELKIQIKIDAVDKDIDGTEKNYEIIISDNCNNGSKAKPKIKEFLEKLKIIGTSSEESINREHKGLKEILVCVAWLKGVRLSEVFKPGSGIYDNLLDVVDVDGNLGYKFTLPVFNKSIEINKDDLVAIEAKHSLYKKFGLVYTCSQTLSEKAQTYYPRCIPNVLLGEEQWKYLFKIKTNSINQEEINQEELPVIIFERKGITAMEGSFYFVDGETNLTSVVNSLEKKNFILFKNHLTKSDDSLSKFFNPDNFKTIFNGNNPLFVENLSGATYSFNLFQISQIKQKQNEIYYRILESFYTKIVIIDERLCPVEVTIIDELIGLINDSSKSEEFVNKYLNRDSGGFVEEISGILKNAQSNIKEELIKWWDRLDNSYKFQIHQNNSINSNNIYMKQRNIFLYSMDKTGTPFDQEGNRLDSFSDLSPHFLSIHIGLLDKLIEFEGVKEASTKDKLKMLKEKLCIPNMTHIAVHSGRGGLTDKNKDITFIPFANLQWAFENSKYMLSELFHNQIYFPI
jgi:hypothetical protein